MWNKIMGEVQNVVPKYNDYLLLDYRKDQVNKAVEYMDIVYNEAIKLFNGTIQYLGYNILSPERRLLYKLENPLASARGEYDIQHSELQLVEYLFSVEGIKYSIHIYLPYYFNHAITINNSNYYVHLAIIEKVIYRNRDGIIVKVMRSPLHFWRNEQFQYSSLSGKFFFDPIITVKAHYKSLKRRKKDIKTTILLYLLATQGLDNTLKLFNIAPEEVSFITGDTEKLPDEGWEYFSCNFDGKEVYSFLENGLFPELNEEPEKSKIYLKVKDTVLNDSIKRRVIASLLYNLKFFHGFTIEMLYDPSAALFKTILGKSTNGMNTKDALAHNHAEEHLKSLATYLDPITSHQLQNIGINCSHIYDLFYQVFMKIDEWLVYHSPSDLFEKKLSVIELLMARIVSSTFIKFYELSNKKKKMMDKNIKKVFKMKPKVIQDIYLCNGLVRSNPAIYNSNWLITIGCKKVRQPANQNRSTKNTNILTSKEHLFHYSMVAVESILTIPTSSPGTGGSINPFIEIDENGCFIVPSDYVADIQGLQKHFTNF